MKPSATVALIVLVNTKEAVLLDSLSDLFEIEILERSIVENKRNPLAEVYRARQQAEHKEQEFADFVEGLIIRAFPKPDILRQGIEWFKSKIRYENYQKSESEAASIIATYAFQVYLEDTERKDFTLTSGEAEVQIKVFTCTASSFEKNQAA